MTGLRFLRFRRLLRHLDERVQAARAEAEQSRAALAETREKVIVPLAEYRQRNHFADLIRESLMDGDGQ